MTISYIKGWVDTNRLIEILVKNHYTVTVFLIDEKESLYQINSELLDDEF